MEAAFIITWKVPFPGREKQALQLAADSEKYWGPMAEQGRCTKPEWYFLPQGIGMWMVKGERKDLEELTESPESRHLLIRGGLLLEDWQFGLAQTGTGAEQYMAEYAKELETV
jgi:hypothetical protein